MTTDLIPHFFAAIPEIFLLLMSLVLLPLSVMKRFKEVSFIHNACIVILLLSLTMIILNNHEPLTAFNDMFVTNKFTQLYKIIIVTTTSVVMAIMPDHLKRLHIYKAEVPILMVLATIGMMIMVSANNFLILYLGIELQSLSFYILISMARHHILSSEAGIKYFVLGALSSIFILYGISLIYGLTGSIFYHEIAQQLSILENPTSFALIGIVMIIVGIAFKLSYAPFHMWTPDVYQGSPTSITAFLATAPKVAAFAVMVQVLYVTLPTLIHIWQPLMISIAVISIAWGATAALFQINLKRIMAYSTITHIGYIGLTLALLEAVALNRLVIYLIVYSITTIGIFAILMVLNRNGKAIEDIDGLKGLARDTPWLAMVLTILLFSLAGIPPFAGFFIKLSVLQVALEAGYTFSVILAVIFSVVSLAYYLKIIKCIYFDEPLGGLQALKIDQVFARPLVIAIITALIINVSYVIIPVDKFLLIPHANDLIISGND